MAAQLNINTEKIEKIKTQVQGINDIANAQATTISEIMGLLEGKSIDVGALQTKSVTPTESAQTVKPDSGYDGLSQVSVGAISKTYVGSGVTKQAAKTITPSTSSQTAVASGVYTTGAVTVGAIPSTYVKPTAKKAATTYTPTTSNQTIAAGTYCSGAQTIEGDANLVAGNIKSGVSIFGVAGSYEGSGGSSGDGASVETAILKVYDCQYVFYTSVENGELVAKCSTGSSTSSNHDIVVCCNMPVVCGRLKSSTAVKTTGMTELGKYSTYVYGCTVPYNNPIGWQLTFGTSGGST